LSFIKGVSNSDEWRSARKGNRFDSTFWRIAFPIWEIFLLPSGCFANYLAKEYVQRKIQITIKHVIDASYHAENELWKMYAAIMWYVFARKCLFVGVIN